ncbi:MAG: hypothetical protein GX892_00940 [Thermoanaerobacteraceae bacterium]|nr:hypothetical protein [Thermoanaerobacteraceae bacterium]
MSHKRKIFAQKKTFAQQGVRSNIYRPAGRPTPREVKSQVAQQESNPPGTRKDVKLNMHDKLN